jgi:hypothetical protein
MVYPCCSRVINVHGPTVCMQSAHMCIGQIYCRAVTGQRAWPCLCCQDRRLAYLCCLQVINVHGPTVSMQSAHINASTYNISIPVQLSGLSLLPASATLQLSQRHLTEDGTTTTDDLLNVELSSYDLLWDRGQVGLQYITLQVIALTGSGCFHH